MSVLACLINLIIHSSPKNYFFLTKCIMYSKVLKTIKKYINFLTLKYFYLIE